MENISEVNLATGGCCGGKYFFCSTFSITTGYIEHGSPNIVISDSGGCIGLIFHHIVVRFLTLILYSCQGWWGS